MFMFRVTFYNVFVPKRETKARKEKEMKNSTRNRIIAGLAAGMTVTGASGTIVSAENVTPAVAETQQEKTALEKAEEAAGKAKAAADAAEARKTEAEKARQEADESAQKEIASLKDAADRAKAEQESAEKEAAEKKASLETANSDLGKARTALGEAEKTLSEEEKLAERRKNDINWAPYVKYLKEDTPEKVTAFEKTKAPLAEAKAELEKARKAEEQAKADFYSISDANRKISAAYSDALHKLDAAKGYVQPKQEIASAYQSKEALQKMADELARGIDEMKNEEEKNAPSASDEDRQKLVDELAKADEAVAAAGEPKAYPEWMDENKKLEEDRFEKAMDEHQKINDLIAPREAAEKAWKEAYQKLADSKTEEEKASAKAELEKAEKAIADAENALEKAHIGNEIDWYEVSSDSSGYGWELTKIERSGDLNDADMAIIKAARLRLQLHRLDFNRLMSKECKSDFEHMIWEHECLLARMRRALASDEAFADEKALAEKSLKEMTDKYGVLDDLQKSYDALSKQKEDSESAQSAAKAAWENAHKDTQEAINKENKAYGEYVQAKHDKEWDEERLSDAMEAEEALGNAQKKEAECKKTVSTLESSVAELTKAAAEAEKKAADARTAAEKAEADYEKAKKAYDDALAGDSSASGALVDAINAEKEAKENAEKAQAAYKKAEEDLARAKADAQKAQEEKQNAESAEKPSSESQNSDSKKTDAPDTSDATGIAGWMGSLISSAGAILSGFGGNAVNTEASGKNASSSGQKQESSMSQSKKTSIGSRIVSKVGSWFRKLTGFFRR